MIPASSLVDLLPPPRGLLPPVSIVSPLHINEFERELSHHPDPVRAQFVLDGIRNGFRIGFQPERVNLLSATGNMRSALEHPGVIDEYLANEVANQRVAGPFRVPPLPSLHCSPFGVIPKKNQPGKWRLILDLSSPETSSVNAGIPKEPFSLRYISVDTAIRVLMELGPGALMAKFDVACAYRNIPIHPDDRSLFGMRWRNHYYVDLTLPFGLRSAPFIFDSVASMVEWTLRCRYNVRFIFHYLDDFLTLAPGMRR